MAGLLETSGWCSLPHGVQRTPVIQTISGPIRDLYLPLKERSNSPIQLESSYDFLGLRLTALLVLVNDTNLHLGKFTAKFVSLSSQNLKKICSQRDCQRHER